MKLRIFIAIGVIFVTLSLHAQESKRQTDHRLSFKPGFAQIKDQFNYGLVNRGLNLGGETDKVLRQILADEALPVVDQIIEACN